MNRQIAGRILELSVLLAVAGCVILACRWIARLEAERVIRESVDYPWLYDRDDVKERILRLEVGHDFEQRIKRLEESSQ